jgi:RNA polymerase sigma-70 factor, ECF subfamily
MAHEDAELIRRWQGGDTRAFEDLVRRWQEPVGRLLARLVGRSELVQDLCQEVFLRLYQAGPRYREQGAFATWLYRIALNVARDAGRRRRHDPLPLADHEPAANGAPPESRCEQQELVHAVAAALAELPASLREVLVLRHYENMNFEAMGRLLHTPASTLKSRFAVALNRLRERLQHLDVRHEEKP